MQRSPPIHVFNISVYYGQQHMHETSIVGADVPQKNDPRLIKILEIGRKMLTNRNIPLFFDNIKITVTIDKTDDVIEYLYDRSV